MVTSNAPDAWVLYGKETARLPCLLRVSRSYVKPKLVAWAPGHSMQEFRMVQHQTFWALGNILFGGIIGCFVDLFSAADVSYDDNVLLELDKLDAEPAESAAAAWEKAVHEAKATRRQHSDDDAPANSNSDPRSRLQ